VRTAIAIMGFGFNHQGCQLNTSTEYPSRDAPPESQVRSRLFAGEGWIRTLGPSLLLAAIRAKKKPTAKLTHAIAEAGRGSIDAALVDPVAFKSG
jgi:hypothetical protein